LTASHPAKRLRRTAYRHAFARRVDRFCTRCAPAYDRPVKILPIGFAQRGAAPHREGLDIEVFLGAPVHPLFAELLRSPG